MKRVCIIYFILQGFICCSCLAQVINIKSAPANVTIDGNAAEWGDLPYSNSKANITYLISNDKDNIYLVIKTKDAACQANILGSGVTWSINLTNEKKNAFQVTFPASGNEDPGEYLNMDTTQLQLKSILTKYKKATVKGFKDITDAQLSTTNPYDIKMVLNYDSTGYLTYEEAIPLSLFHADISNKEWAFNIKFNGLQRKVKYIGNRVWAFSNDPNVVLADINSKYPDIIDANSIKLTPQGIELTPSVEFEGKFILAK